MFSITIAVVFGLSDYLMFKNNEKLILDVSKDNMNDLVNTLNSIEKDVVEEDTERIYEHIEVIAKYSSSYMQNFDKESLKNILRSNTKKEGIMLIQIWDDDLDDLFLMYLIENHKIIFITKIPEKLEKLEKFTVSINDTSVGTKDKIGKVTAYHDSSHSIDKIIELKEKSKKKILSLNIKINDRLRAFTKDSTIIYLMGFIISLIIMAIILKQLINDPLKKLQSGFNDFFLFIQKKNNNIEQIDIRSNDEFEEIANFLNGSIEISSKIFEDISKLNIALHLKNKEERVLLDNSSQGFLTFDKHFIVSKEYSRKCEKMIGFDIANRNILDILFLTDNESIDKSKRILLDALSMDSKIAQKSILTLLPKNTVLNKMYLTLEYKIVEDNRFLLIITNDSKQKKLESKIQKKQKILKMIVAVTQDSDMFYDTKKDFEYFIKNKVSYISNERSPSHNLNELHRIIHTFKGTFLQLFMDDTANKLHKLESQLSSRLSDTPEIINKEISNFINEIDFNSFMDNDIDAISEELGKEFVNNEQYITVDSNIIEDIKHKYMSLLEGSSIKNKLSKEILDEIIFLLQKPLIFQLYSYPKLAVQLAQTLRKEIYEFNVIGSRDIVAPEELKPFIKSLVHIFRNAVAHGIEMPEQRIELDKDHIGTITCGFYLVKDNLRIIISDDGRGIDTEKIKAQIPKDIDVSKLSNGEIHLYIFKEHISTASEVTTTSGRGIGMSAVKSEIEKIGGSIEIKSEINVGTTFVFNVPFKAKEI